jgi:hypothetical protein
MVITAVPRSTETWIYADGEASSRLAAPANIFLNQDVPSRQAICTADIPGKPREPVSENVLSGVVFPTLTVTELLPVVPEGPEPRARPEPGVDPADAPDLFGGGARSGTVPPELRALPPALLAWGSGDLATSGVPSTDSWSCPRFDCKYPPNARPALRTVALTAGLTAKPISRSAMSAPPTLITR